MGGMPSDGPTFPDLMRVPAASAVSFSPEPHMVRRVLAHNERLMLVEHHMEPGWVGKRHAHPHDQLVYVISGKLQFSCGDQRFEVGAGDSFVIRGGMEHEARADVPSVVLDVFTPVRDDYLS